MIFELTVMVKRRHLEWLLLVRVQRKQQLGWPSSLASVEQLAGQDLLQVALARKLAPAYLQYC